MATRTDAGENKRKGEDYVAIARRLGATRVANTNLLIGTGGGGWGISHNNPGVQYPFAPLRLGPDTSQDAIWVNFNHMGGYYDRDSHIRCFSHTHVVGAGARDFGNFGVMALNRTVTDDVIVNYNYRSLKDRASQQQYPGYFSVFLEDVGVLAEFTAAGLFSAMHRYTFVYLNSDPRVLLVDVCHNVANGDDSCVVADVALDVETFEISAHVRFRGALTANNPRGGVDVFFYGRLRTESVLVVPTGWGTWKNAAVTAMSNNASKVQTDARSLGLWVEYPPQTDVVYLDVGISFLSKEEARNNLAVEFAGRSSFNQLLEDAIGVWESHLAVIADVELRADQSADDVVEVTTALYRSFKSPTIYTEPSSRQFLTFDARVATSQGEEKRISDLSLWDTFRTQHPFLVLVRPDIAVDSVRSLIEMAQECGDMPRWPIANWDGNSMIGDSGNSVIVDLITKRPEVAATLDLEDAFEAMKRKALGPTNHSKKDFIDEYNAYGFIPIDINRAGSAPSLHFYYDDYAISRLASHLGHDVDADVFYQRSLNYSKLYDPEHLFLSPTFANGSHFYVPPENIGVSYGAGFWIEGNTCHYTWFVQHDEEGLLQLFPSVDAFNDQLNSCFERYANSGPLQFANLLPNEGYWAGNEPGLYNPFVFAHVGNRSDLTQKWTRYIMETSYLNAPNGLPGNDDYATLSAWYTFAAMGFYPNPMFDYYVLSSPLFARLTLALPNDAVLDIIAHDNSNDNVYVQQVLWNGVRLCRPFITHSQIAAGGVLEFFMTSDPQPFQC